MPAVFLPKMLKVPASTNFKSRLKIAPTTFAEATELLKPLAADGDHIFGLTRGQASMIDLALAAMEIAGAPVDLSVWTWVVADYEIALVESLLDDKRVSAFRMVVDQGCLSRRPGFINNVIHRFGGDAVRVTVNHSKIAMVRGPHADILLRGSMNFNQNRCLEQFDATWSFDLCEWFEGVMAQVWEVGKAPDDPDASRSEFGSLLEDMRT